MALYKFDFMLCYVRGAKFDSSGSVHLMRSFTSVHITLGCFAYRQTDEIKNRDRQTLSDRHSLRTQTNTHRVA